MSGIAKRARLIALIMEWLTAGKLGKSYLLNNGRLAPSVFETDKDNLAENVGEIPSTTTI